MEIDSCLRDNLQAYSLLFNKTRFAFVTKMNMENLKMFSIQNQQKLGKVDVRLNINAIKHLRNNRNFNYLVMTEYDQIIPMIYLLRSQPKQCKILATKIVIETALIYAKDFHNVIKKINQFVSQPITYDQENQFVGNYEAHFQINFDQWVPIYEKQEIQNFVSRCIGLNYGQIFNTQKGVLLTPYPSGVNVGSSAWLLSNPLTKRKLLWVQEISHHKWRACQQFSIDQIHNKINTIVFTSKALSKTLSSPNQDQNQCLEYFKAISQRLSKSFNIRIVIRDILIIPDFINYVAYEFRQKMKKLFFTGVSVSKMMSYINSYPQFLTFNHQKRIYQDPPVYPFDTYQKLKQRIISQGTLYEVSAEKKIPMQQLILRSTPYLHFQSDFHANLIEGQNQIAQTIVQKYYDLTKLQKFIQSVETQKIICMCRSEQDIKNIPDLGSPFTINLMEETIYVPEQNREKYYTSLGQKSRKISRYTKKNGYLELSSITQPFKLLNKNWINDISLYFSKNNIENTKKDQNSLQTKLSKIFLQNYKIMVESQSQNELELIQKYFSINDKYFFIQKNN